MISFKMLLLITVILIIFLYCWLIRTYSYFKRKGIPYLEPNLLFGNMADAILVRKSMGECFREIYNKLSPHRFGGVYTFQKRTIVIRDAELIRNVLIKDFDYFHDRGISVNRELEPLAYHLFNMNGDEWKNLRIKLTSTFTSSKMKMMFPLIKKCGEKLQNVLEQIPSNEAIDIKDMTSRFTTDAIGTCAFGLETGSLDNPNSEFRQMGKKIFQFRYQTVVRTLWTNIPSRLIKLLRLSIFEGSMQEFFQNIVDKTVQYREQNDITRYDFLDLLIALKNNTVLEKFQDGHDNEDLQKFLQQIGDKRIKSNVEMTNELLAAQCFVFFAAGFETSSSTLAFTLLELAQNRHIQDKLRHEIHSVLENNNNEITYKTMKQMTYMDLVLEETLRKYPPASVLFRVCKENYKIPDTEVIIPKNTSVIIPIWGLQMDEKYYDNPEEFRPERFTEEEKAKRPNYTHLPFGEGPRICIAQRFARMQVKIGLIYLLKNFTYRVSSKMKLPIEFEKSFGLLTVRDGIWLHRDKV